MLENSVGRVTDVHYWASESLNGNREFGSDDRLDQDVAGKVVVVEEVKPLIEDRILMCDVCHHRHHHYYYYCHCRRF